MGRIAQEQLISALLANLVGIVRIADTLLVQRGLHADFAKVGHDDLRNALVH